MSCTHPASRRPPRGRPSSAGQGKVEPWIDQVPCSWVRCVLAVSFARCKRAQPAERWGRASHLVGSGGICALAIGARSLPSFGRPRNILGRICTRLEPGRPGYAGPKKDQRHGDGPFAGTAPGACLVLQVLWLGRRAGAGESDEAASRPVLHAQNVAKCFATRAVQDLPIREE